MTFPDLLRREPFERGRGRLRRGLVVDRPVLLDLRRGAVAGETRAVTTYAWALGVAEGAVEGVDPVRTSEATAEAAEVAPDDPAVQFAFGLAHAGGFSQRRGLPLDARRGFTAAARLDPANLLPHLAVAAARYSAGDFTTAERSLNDARQATAYRPYLSPLGEELLARSPWLATSLAYLWPQRTATMVRYMVEAVLHEVSRSRRRQRAPEDLLDALLVIGRRMVETAPRRPTVWLPAAEALLLSLDGRAAFLDDSRARSARDEAQAVLDEVVAQQRESARRFEAHTRRQLGGSGAGAAAGLAVALFGLTRSRQPWRVLVDRNLTLAGLGLAAGAAAVSLLPNPLADANRQRVERDLVAAEARQLDAATERLNTLVAPFLPPSEVPLPEPETGEQPTE